MANGNSIKTFEEYNKLTKEQKEFYHFDQLSKIDLLYNKVDNFHANLDEKYAQKRVEYIVYSFVSLVLVSVVIAILSGLKL